MCVCVCVCVCVGGWVGVGVCLRDAKFFPIYDEFEIELEFVR